MISPGFLKRAARCFKVVSFVFFVSVVSTCKKSEPAGAGPVVELAKDKELQSFNFRATANAGLLGDLTGEIKGDTVYVAAFAGTNLRQLIPEFTFKGQSVTVSDVKQQSGVTANSFLDLVKYTVAAADNSKKYYVVKFNDNNVPALYINTSGTAITSKEIYVAGTVKTVSNFNTESATLVMEIKGHGNSTWTDLPKKPYKIKLDKKASLLGMPATKSWILLANYADKTLMRNEVAFSLSRSIGRAATVTSRYVELYVNNVYLGNYQLTQQVKEGLVGIEEQSKTDVTLPNISGGYLLEQDLFPNAEPVYFRTAKNMPFDVKYPDEDINQEQKDYIKAHFQKAEDALFAANFADPVNGYRKYIDVDSYVDYYIVNEVIGNPDIFRSTSLYKKRNDDKIYTGPIWDFDKAANNDNRPGNQVNGLMLNAAFEPKTWIKKMMEDPTFRQKIRSRWNELKPKIYAVPGVLDQLAKQLAYSQVYNFTKWDILTKKIYLEIQVAGSYAGEVQYLKTFLTNHITWLDQKFNSAEYQ
jgi:hypothetical protein